MLPADDRIIETCERIRCFNVHFRLLKTIYVHLLVCYLNKLQTARCNDKDTINDLGKFLTEKNNMK